MLRTKDDVLGWNGRINADNDEISIKTNSQDKVSLNYIIQNQRAVFHVKLLSEYSISFYI